MTKIYMDEMEITCDFCKKREPYRTFFKHNTSYRICRLCKINICKCGRELFNGEICNFCIETDYPR